MIKNNLFESMDMIINDTGVLVYVIDLKSYEIIYANERCKEEFGRDIIGKCCYRVFQKDEKAPCDFCSVGEKDELKIGDTSEWENVNSINKKHYICNDRVVLWSHNKKVKIQVARDVTQQYQLQQALHREKDNAVASFEALLDATIEGILIFDEQRRCKLVNQVLAKILGYKREEMIGMHAMDFIAEDSLKRVKEQMRKSVQEPYEANMKRKDGSVFPALLRGNNVVLAGENVRVSAIIDISEQKAYEAEILKLAHYDMLTALPNRVLFKEYISQAIHRSKRINQYYALLFIDLDNFKMVNDTVGHNIGDQVLIETANRLKSAVRKNDIVARLGGDEFVILIETSQKKRDEVVTNIVVVTEKILEHLQQPYYIGENIFRISASIGIKLFNDDKLSMDELMRYADSAMYNAKFAGKNRFEFFNPELQKIMEEKILLIDDLRDAIEKKNMTLYYQPQIFYAKNEKNVVGVEALIRWIDPDKGIISPADFIPLAEESGLIVELGRWILQEAASQLEIWSRDKEKKEWRVSINVSSQQFEEENFVALLRDILKRYKINPKLIMLELTEGVLIQNETTIEKLNELKELGFSLSIDDFGTGYSSLAYLKKLPMDELKIDKSFVDDLLDDENDEIIVQTIISIGQKFGMDVIAEGVETKAQFKKLCSLGCKLFQGYFFAKPTKAELL